MKLRNALVSTLLIICLSKSGASQARRIQAGGGTIGTQKASIYFQTYLDPGAPDLKDYGGGGMSGFGTWTPDQQKFQVHRYVGNSARHVYFGYDVSVEALTEANTYRVTMSKLTLTPEKYREMSSSDRSWTLLPIPGWDETTVRTVRGGEVVAVALLTNVATNQKIVDYFTVQETNSQREFRFAPGSARDFRAEDVELRIGAPRVTINGKFDAPSSQLQYEVSGGVVWLYFPNRGRYVLSLSPHADLGFRKVGEVRGTTMTFTVGSDTFNIVCGTPIAPGTGAFNLYALADPAWRPTGPRADQVFNMGGEDRAEWFLQKEGK